MSASNPPNRGAAETNGTEGTSTGTNQSTNSGNGGTISTTTSRRNRHRGNRGSRENTNYLRDFNGEVPDVGAVLGTATEQKDMKDRYQTLIDKLVSYVTRSTSYPNARDIEPLLTDLVDVRAKLDNRLPKEPMETKDGTEVPITSGSKLQYYQIKLKSHVERENHLENNIFQLFKLVWGQLSEALQNRVKREKDWKARKDDSDVAWLLTTIKCLAANVDHTNNVFKSAIVCLKSLIAIKQQQNESMDTYRRRYEGIFDTLSIIGLKNIFRQQEFADSHASGKLDESEESLKAMCFFLGADSKKYGSLFHTLDTDTLLGNDQYPTDMGTAFDVLCRYNEGRSNSRRQDNDTRDGDRDRSRQQQQHFSFLQAGEALCPGTDGQITKRGGRYPRCYKCNKIGHLADNCPTPNTGRAGTQSVLIRLALAQGSDGYIIDPNWILIDTCSNVTSFINPNLLTDIKDCEQGDEMRVLANGNGEQNYFQKGKDVYMSLPTYFNTESIANIIAMTDATSKYRSK